MLTHIAVRLGHQIKSSIISKAFSKEQSPSKVHQVVSHVTMLYEIVHFDFMPFFRTVKREYYVGVFCSLREVIRRKPSELK